MVISYRTGGEDDASAGDGGEEHSVSARRVNPRNKKRASLFGRRNRLDVRA
jgi:hypothetical protein